MFSTDSSKRHSMVSNSDLSDKEIRDMDQKEFRKKFPSGWMELTRYETQNLVLDALLESPASREFTTSELSEKAGPSKKSIKNRIDSLVEIGVVEKLEEGRDEPRYSINNKSPITRAIYTLNLTVNKVKQGELPKNISESPSPEDINTAGEERRDSRYNVPESNHTSNQTGQRIKFTPDPPVTG